MNKINLLVLILISFFLYSCNAQENETYWESVNVTKENNESIYGVTSGYMDMITEMQFLISKNNDLLFISYPFEKKIKLSDLKSLTNVRIKTGQLLDSVYAVVVDGDILKIKFNYIGTSQDDQRFSLNFKMIKKEDYHRKLTDLLTKRKSILDDIKPLDFSNLRLTQKADYIHKKEALSSLNPIQLAEELANNNENSFQFILDEFSLLNNKQKINYETVGLTNTNTINKTVATIDGISFNNIEFINDVKTKQTNAIIVSKKEMHKDEIKTLYNYISKNGKNGHIEQFGLPKIYKEGDVLGIHNFLAINWKLEDRVIKMAIENIPDELWDMEISDNMALKENYTQKDIDEVFRYYLNLIKKSEVKLFIVSNDFDKVLNAKENNRESLTNGNIHDYIWKWVYITDLLDKN